MFGVLTEQRRPQWIETDTDLRVTRNCGTPLLADLPPGSDLTDALPCIVGAEELAPIVFPVVNLDEGHAVDVHLFSDHGGFQVLLLDSSREMATRQPEQQQSNEVALLNHRLTRLTEQLEVARRQAETASAAKSRFIAGMSHELRTPLTSILGFSDLMSRGVVTDSEGARSINESASYLLGLVDNLLEHGSVEQGQARVTPEPVDLETFFESLARLAEPLAARKGLHFEVSGPVEGGQHWVVVDPLRVRQILFNLLTNAVRYTEHGEVRLSWETGAQRLRIAVSDTGPGIDPAAQERIFLAFTRSSEHGHGLGLGLSISQTLAEAMQGSLSVSSRPGEGSTFVLDIAAPLVDSPAQRQPEAAETTATPRVLVVDDDPNIRAVLQLALEEQDYDVYTCVDFNDARQKLVDHAPHIALVDLDLYGEDGLEVVAMIQQQSPGLPTLAMSAAVGDQVRTRAADRGCCGFIEKPFDFVAVAEALDAHLGRHD